jgi:hypothetical protein
VAAYRNLRRAHCRTAAVRRIGGEAAACALHSADLSVLCRQFDALLAVADARCYAGDRCAGILCLVSVFSLFAVAVFWSFMADLFTAEQGKRLFGFIGAGGTAGGLLGPLITIQLSRPVGSVNLLIAAAVLLEITVFCVYRLEQAATVHGGVDGKLHAAPQRIGGSAFAAFLEFVRSPYLLGVGLWVSLLSFRATIVYFDGQHHFRRHP